MLTNEHICVIIFSMEKRDIRFCRIQSAGALLVGGGLYWLLCENTYINALLKRPDWIQFRSPAATVLRYYAADFLWAYALCFALLSVLSERAACIVTVCSGLVWECLQAAGIVSGVGDGTDVWMYAGGTILALILLKEERKTKNMKKITCILLTVLILAAFAVCALGSGETSSQGEGTVSGEKEKDTELDDCCVEIKGCRRAKDYEGKDVVIIQYTFTNTSDDACAFYLAVDDAVFQNDIGLNEAYFLSDKAKYNSDNQTKEIKKGASLDVEVAYELNDTKSDVVVEVKELFSFNDKTITKTFKL